MLFEIDGIGKMRPPTRKYLILIGVSPEDKSENVVQIGWSIPTLVDTFYQYIYTRYGWRYEVSLAAFTRLVAILVISRKTKDMSNLTKIWENR